MPVTSDDIKKNASMRAGPRIGHSFENSQEIVAAYIVLAIALNIFHQPSLADRQTSIKQMMLVDEISNGAAAAYSKVAERIMSSIVLANGTPHRNGIGKFWTSWRSATSVTVREMIILEQISHIISKHNATNFGKLCAVWKISYGNNLENGAYDTETTLPNMRSSRPSPLMAADRQMVLAQLLELNVDDQNWVFAALRTIRVDFHPEVSRIFHREVSHL